MQWPLRLTNKGHGVCILFGSVRQNKCKHHRGQSMPTPTSADHKPDEGQGRRTCSREWASCEAIRRRWPEGINRESARLANHGVPHWHDGNASAMGSSWCGGGTDKGPRKLTATPAASTDDAASGANMSARPAPAHQEDSIARHAKHAPKTRAAF